MNTLPMLTLVVTSGLYLQTPTALRAQEPQSHVIKLQTELCVALAGNDSDRANCYINGYTSAVMATKLTTENLTGLFPADFKPWQQSIQLWRQYTGNEDAVMKQVFAPDGNPSLTLGGALAVYLVGTSRLELLETYQAKLAE